MSNSQKTENTYKTIIDRLITEIKGEVINEGCNEDMLKELKNVRLYLKINYFFYF